MRRNVNRKDYNDRKNLSATGVVAAFKDCIWEITVFSQINKHIDTPITHNLQIHFGEC